MKVYVQTDIEGVAGFCFFENRKNDSYENYQHRLRMYHLLTAEVNAAVRAAYDAGATEVLVNDNHGSGYNIRFEDLDPRCRIIHGRNCSGPQWLNLLDGGWDAMVLVGMHAMGGTPCSITPHSLWQVNDGAIMMSEASMAAAIAGDLRIPTVFISGDDKVCAEVSAKIPAIETAVVKQALSPYMACSVIPARAAEMIYAGVKKALGRMGSCAPYVVPGPVKLTLLDSPNHCPPLNETGAAVICPTITQAFDEFENNMPWTHFNTRLPDGFVFP